MNNEIGLFITCSPKGKARARTVSKNGMTWSFTPKNTKDLENHIKSIAYEYMKKNRIPYITTPMELEAVFHMEIPKSMEKQILTHQPHTIKPDIDNLIKLLLDALNEVVYEDDKLIYAIKAKKIYSKTIGINWKIKF